MAQKIFTLLKKKKYVGDVVLEKKLKKMKYKLKIQNQGNLVGFIVLSLIPTINKSAPKTLESTPFTFLFFISLFILATVYIYVWIDFFINSFEIVGEK